jgi:DNA-binding transcriptional MerR regulator
MEQTVYSIKDIAAKTGVNPITLRAWERRYGLFKPKRNDRKQRVFTEDDLIRIREILSWLDKGMPISKVKTCLQHKKSVVHPFDSPDEELYQHIAIEAVSEFDPSKLEKGIDELFSLYPLSVIAEWVYPRVVSVLNERWKNVETASAESHFFDFHVRNKLATYFTSPHQAKNNKTLLVGSIGKVYNEIELLFLAAALAFYGFDIILLGCDIPLEQFEKISIVGKVDGLIICTEEKKDLLESLAKFSDKAQLKLCIRTRHSITDAAIQAALYCLPLSYGKLLEQINTIFS